VAKGIANGFPMGGVLISPDFKPVYGQLGTTFGGNHLACAAALAVLDVFEDEGLVENARIVGDYLMEGIRGIGSSHILDVRGRGLMIGIELDMPHQFVRKPLIKHEHCFTGCAGQSILRLLPPLCLTKAEADDFIEKSTNSSELRERIEQVMITEKLYLQPNLKLHDLVRYVQSNRNYVYNAINKEMGISFNEYVNRLRIDHSIRLIQQHPDMPLAEVAEKSGFTSIASFYRNFKQFTGKSPKEYSGGG
jgi:AraC-like DNA-binding protein